MYNTTLDAELIRQIKILAAQQEKRQNDLLEEAIQDLLKKYESKAENWYHGDNPFALITEVFESRWPWGDDSHKDINGVKSRK